MLLQTKKLWYVFNPLNAELNPICHLLALLGVHHIFHVSGLRVKECCCNATYHYCYYTIWQEVTSFKFSNIVHYTINVILSIVRTFTLTNHLLQFPWTASVYRVHFYCTF